MFTNLGTDAISTVLDSQDGNMAQAVEVLLSMSNAAEFKPAVR